VRLCPARGASAWIHRRYHRDLDSKIDLLWNVLDADFAMAIGAMCRFGNQIRGRANHEQRLAAISWRRPVDQQSFTIAVYCLVDEVLAALASDPDWRRTGGVDPRQCWLMARC
jgi:hypothetical protein